MTCEVIYLVAAPEDPLPSFLAAAKLVIMPPVLAEQELDCHILEGSTILLSSKDLGDSALLWNWRDDTWATLDNMDIDSVRGYRVL